MAEKKPYSEMSMEELEIELSYAEIRLKSEELNLYGKHILQGEYWDQKKVIDAAEWEVNEIKRVIFGKNQEASLSRLNEKSIAALEEYYQYDVECSSGAYLFMSFINLRDGYAIKIEREKLNGLKENVVDALKEQGISGSEFDSIYEYYKFARDAMNTAAEVSAIAESYENSSDWGKVGMNTMTVLTTPFRGIRASQEFMASFSYEDPYAPLNVNSSYFGLTNITDTVRAETLEDINSDAGKFFYQTGMSMADFSTLLPLAAVTGGTATTLSVMGLNASTSSAKDATLRGASKDQALMTGLASGSIEVVTEKLPLDYLFGIFKGGGKVPLNMLKYAGIQGIQEGLAEGGNAFADNYINGLNSQFSMSVQAYTNEGKSLEDAQKLALQDVLKNMGSATLSGVVSGGFYGTSAHIMGKVATKSSGASTVSESVNGYSKDGDSVWRYKIDPSKDAWGWQGGDTYSGKDNYETIVLEGSKQPIYLVKLEGSSSGYFTTLEAYENLRDADGKVSAVTLSEGLQVEPWRNNATGQCEYRTQVAIYKLESDMEVALGEQTLANYQYGEGELPQIYIPGYDAKNQANNDAMGLKKMEVEDLKDSVISEMQFDEILDKNMYQIAKRDLFLMQSAKDNILQLKNESTNATVQQTCQAYLDILNNDIKEQQALLDGYEADMGELPSQTYDDVNKYLAEKHSGTALIQDDMEAKIAEVRTDLMRQIQSSIQTNIKSIDYNKDYMMTVYDANNYCTREQEKINQMLKNPAESKLNLTPEKIDVTTDPNSVKAGDNLKANGATAVKPPENAVDMTR